MRVFIRLTVVIATMIAIGACSSPTGSSGGGTVFRARDIEGNWYDVPADRLATGNTVEVYAESNAGVSSSTAVAIAREFDTSIHQMVRTRFGPESDVDKNGKIILLLLDIQDGYNGSGGYVAGYYDPVHVLPGPNSNSAEMLFLDTNPLVPGSDEFYLTVAHEMQHLVNDVRSLEIGVAQDIWIDEGLSSAAEYLYAGEQIQAKIDWFTNDVDGTANLGNNFFVWNGYWEQTFSAWLANYSTVYLFFQWLRVQAASDAPAFDDTTIYAEIFNSLEPGVKAVTDAAASLIDPSFSDWETLFASWLHANEFHEPDGPNGLAGYRDQVGSFVPPRWSRSDDDWPFSPGEAAYFHHGLTGHTPSLSGSNPYIRYHGINTSTGAVDKVGTTYTGDLTLIFNADDDPTSDDQYAYLPSMGTPVDVPAEAGVTARSALSGNASYPIGFHPEQDRGAPTTDGKPIGSRR